MRTLLLPLLISLPLTASVAITAPARLTEDHVAVELLTEHVTFKPGTRTWLGIKFTHEPHWHTYWVNPGDSGLPTRFEWQLPKGFRVGDVAWPAPQRFAVGDLYNFGYDATTMPIVPIDVPAEAAANGSVTIAATVKWLICNDVCIPGKGSVRTEVPIATDEPVRNAKTANLFASTRARLPVPVAAQPNGKVTAAGDRVQIELRGIQFPPASELDAFATEQKLLGNSPPKISLRGDQLIIVADRNEYFESAPKRLSVVLTHKASGKGNAAGRSLAWQFDIPWAITP